MSLSSNLLPRLRLLRIALTRRFIYPEITEMAAAYGLDYTDVPGDLQPFALVRAIEGGLPPVDLGKIEPVEAFTPSDAPAQFNSEPSVARFLGELAFRRRARTVIELGCFVGWTTAHLAMGIQAHGGGRVVALDPCQQYLDTMMANLRRNGGLDSLVTPVRGMSLDPGALAALPPQADLIFLDTSHAYPATRDEILAYAGRLTPGGCFVLHDSVNASGVRRSIAEVAGRFRVHTFATERSNGVTVLLPRRAP
ncbi:MAG TPA: class I SAM-dependent methyltransferase [Opitutaceae bacterium]|nr:class I SAM-dependent methyltransferase [Opitutaceae bacterium]